MSTGVVTGKVRLSYVNLFEPRAQQGGDPKYSVTVLLPKTDAVTMLAIQAAITEATQIGVSKRWDGKQPAKLDIPIHDGDGGRPSDGEPFGDECKGCWVFSASAKQQPGVVDQRVQPIIDSTQVYSGMYAHVDINLYPYSSNGRKGIGIGLNNVQKVADGEPLAGRRSAAEAFKPIAPQPGQPSTFAPQGVPAPAPATFNPYQPQQPAAPVGYGADQYGQQPQQPAAQYAGQPQQPWL